jgi:hypothetical protein
MAKFVAAAEAREFNADALRVIAHKFASRSTQDKLLARRELVAGKSDYHKDRAALKKFLAGADGKTLRGAIVEMMLWEWQGLDPEVSKALGAIFKLKVQASAKE